MATVCSQEAEIHTLG
jgi:WD40 repeat protein